MKTRIVAAAAVAVLALGMAGCVREPLPESMRIDTRPFKSESSSSWSGGDTEVVDTKGATEAEIDLGMGAGEMKVRSGDTSALAELSFEYAEDMRPETSYEVSGKTGTLTISQPNVRYKFGEPNPNSWDIRLAKSIPYELRVQMGAGSSRLDLSELDVRLLTVQLGAGESTLDLTGPRTENLSGEIQAGVGQLTIVLPRDVGVKVTGRKEGVGTFEANGFKVMGDAYVNDAYGTTTPTIELDVMRGVGEVKLELQ